MCYYHTQKRSTNKIGKISENIKIHKTDSKLPCLSNRSIHDIIKNKPPHQTYLKELNKTLKGYLKKITYKYSTSINQSVT